MLLTADVVQLLGVSALSLAFLISGSLNREIPAKAHGGLHLTADVVQLLGLSALSLAFLISGSYNPFLYFRF